MSAAQPNAPPWLSATEVLQLDAVGLEKAFRARQLSPLEVARAVLKAVEASQSTLNAFVAVEHEGALSAARESEKRWQHGAPLSPLDGVPVSVKDNIYVQGLPTRFGSRAIPESQVIGADSPSVARLREHGAIVFGKTTTPEYAHKMVTNSLLTGVTRNPWNLAHSPGGSSGGAAAAVSAGIGPIGICTDGAGSIRIPAAWTGTYGLKTSFGRVPHHPRGAFPSFSHVGPICRTVTDAARVLPVLCKPDARDWYSLPHTPEEYESTLGRSLRGVRVAFSPGLGMESVRIDAQIVRAIEGAARVFESLGATVEAVDPPGMQECVDVCAIYFLSYSARLAGELGERAALLDPSFAALAEMGRQLPPSSMVDAEVRRGVVGSQINQFFERYDLVLAPATHLMPPALTQVDSIPDLRPMLTQWCNVTGQPAASICCGFSDDGLPIGLQIVGRRWAEGDVLRASYAYEQARGDLSGARRS